MSQSCCQKECPKAREMFNAIDANHDGKVSHEEIKAYFQKQCGCCDQKCKAAFQVADANKDGWLSKEELLTMRHYMRGGHGRR